MFVVGLAAALVASALFNLGIVLQALDARLQPPERGLRLSLLIALLRRPRWVAGFLMGGVGFLLEVLAFEDAPFVVVQPALAAGLLLLLFLGVRILGERIGWWETAGVVAMVGGIALLAAGAPGHSETHRSQLAILAVVAGLTLVAVAPFAVRGRRMDTALLVIVGSAAGFAAGNVATKLMSDDLNHDHYLPAVVWLAVTLGTGILAVITEMTALQRRAATTVVPLSFAVQTFLPIVLEPAFLSERWSSAPGYGIPLALGLVLILVGMLAVSRTRAVSTLASGEVGKPPAAGAASPGPGPSSSGSAAPSADAGSWRPG
ncbi:MAG: hypothetical protein QOI98_3156 [Solirubrobacteraceae bacterium]|nr:hypothetical protein [Solirubrobacteraceae bacterium]